MAVLFTMERAGAAELDTFTFLTAPSVGGTEMTMRVNIPNWQRWSPGNGDYLMCYIDILVNSREATFPPADQPYIRCQFSGVYDFSFSTDDGSIFTDVIGFRGQQGQSGDVHDPPGDGPYVVLATGPSAPDLGSTFNGPIQLLSIGPQGGGPYEWPASVAFGVEYRGPSTSVDIDFGDGTTTRLTAGGGSVTPVQHTYSDAGDYIVNASLVRDGYTLGAFCEVVVDGLLPFTTVSLVPSGASPEFTFTAQAAIRPSGPPAT